MRIWQRYIFLNLFKFLGLFFFLICFIYISIDFSSHSYKLIQASRTVVLFYLTSQIIQNLDFFLNLALLLAILKVFLDFNRNFELVALQSFGISRKRLSLPAIYLSFLLFFILIFRAEFLDGSSMSYMQQFQEKVFLQHKKKTQKNLFHIRLHDQSNLVFSNYDKNKKELFDVFWILSKNNIWHMKQLKLTSKNLPAEGYFIDHFESADNDALKKVASYEHRKMNHLHLNFSEAKKMFTPLDQRSLSELFLLQEYFSPSEKAFANTCLFYKLTMCFFPFLITLNLCPFCIRFSKKMNGFIFCALSLFSFFAVSVFLKALVCLGENQVLHPFFASGLIFFIFLFSGLFLTFKKA